MDVRQRLARNVNELRYQRGWSQEELAEHVGVHRTYASDVCRGARNPTITVVEKFATAFGVSTGKLLD